MRSLSFALASALLITTSSASWAQIVPPTAAPERVQRDILPRSLPTPRQDAVIEQEGATTAGDAAIQEVSFVLNDMMFEGNSVYDDDILKMEVSDYLGKRVTMREINQLARNITAKYRRDGYILSRAFIGPQRIKDGVVTLQIAEGHISDVNIQGEIKGSEELLRAYAAKIQESKPLNVKTLERYLLLADDLPGVTARGILQPSQIEAGASSLVLLVGHDTYEGAIQADNRGSRLLGPYQLTGIAAANSILGMYERTTVRGILTSEVDELRFIDVAHEQQIGNEGTRIELRGAYSMTEPGSFLEPLNIEGESTRFEVAVEHPFVRSRTYNVFARVGFEMVDTETDISGIELYDDSVRTLFAGFNLDVADDWRGINLLDMQLRQGIDAFGASDDGLNRSRPDGEADFTSINATITRLQDLPRDFSLFTSVTGQYAFDPLLSSEEFGVGGSLFGSAYDPSEITGDHGVAFRGELRYGRATDYEYLSSYQAYLYYDFGAVWEEDGLPGVSGRDTLASFGPGVRFNVNSQTTGFVELAVPLTRNVSAERNDGDQPRLFVGLVRRF